MSLLSGVSSFFGLDIGTTGMRVVELRGSGATRSLVKYAYVPIDSKMSQSDSKADHQKMAQTLANLITEARLSTKTVSYTHLTLPTSDLV